MHQEPFDQWMQEAAQSYREPPDTDLNSLWDELNQRRNHQLPVSHIANIRPRRWHAQPWLRAAALLVVGVGIGRVSVSSSNTAVTPRTEPVAEAPALLIDAALDVPGAERYLGQTVALLASLNADARSTFGDTLMTARASRLLSTTRFLLDSPTASDPNVRALLEDLELVLVQIVQIPASKSASDVELIHQAMQQRDVMPRLRSAVANLNSAD